MSTTQCNAAARPRVSVLLLSLDELEAVLALTAAPLPLATSCRQVARLAREHSPALRLAWLRRSMDANAHFVTKTLLTLRYHDVSFPFFNRYLLRNARFVPDLCDPLDEVKPNPFPPAFVSWLLHAQRWFPLPPADDWLPLLQSFPAASARTDDRAHWGPVPHLVLVLRLPLMYMIVGRMDDMALVLHGLLERCPRLLPAKDRDLANQCVYGPLLLYDACAVYSASVWERPLAYTQWLQSAARLCFHVPDWETTTIKRNASEARTEACLRVIQTVIDEAKAAK